MMLPGYPSRVWWLLNSEDLLHQNEQVAAVRDPTWRHFNTTAYMTSAFAQFADSTGLGTRTSNAAACMPRGIIPLVHAPWAQTSPP